jgi:nucleoside-diphosphate-sugar epimerase
MARIRAMNRKVLILGCSGEVGSRVTLLLLKYGFTVHGVSGSKLCKINDRNHFCKKINLLDPRVSLNLDELKPDVMVHTAWVTTPGVFWESPINDEWVKASKKIIQEFEQSGGKYLVVTSTCAEYSWETPKPLSETSETNPKLNYGKSKLELLNWMKGSKIPFLWTRTFFQFGLNEPIGRLIPSMVDSMLAGKEFEVQNPNDIRDFVYISDVAEVLSTLICKEQLGIVNIGTGNGLDISSVAQKIVDQIGHENLVRYSASTQPASVVVSNPNRLLSIVGKYSWTPIDKAISETIKARIKQ